MDTSPTGAQTRPTAAWPDCVELGIWTKVPTPPPESCSLKLKDVDKKGSKAIRDRGVMTFHTVGCTGCHADQRATTQVAEAMAAQVAQPQRFGGSAAAVPAAFLYHLGDVVYKKDKDTVGEQSPLPPPDKRHDFSQLYDAQFYAAYGPPIFAVAGNHDGKDRDPDGPARKSAIHHFLKNFCGLQDGDPPDNRSSGRPAMTQPYPYWLLETPLAYFVGLYTNVSNAGQLDDPEGDGRPQYDWLVRTLKEVREAADGKAVVLALHYPPYSAAANFPQRGDPNLAPSAPAGKTLEPLGMLLQRAFRASETYPDAVLSAHAHHYQRLTYTHADGRQIPYLVVGGGGHAPVEKLSTPCLKKDRDAGGPDAAPGVVYPPGLSLPAGDRVELAAFDDEEFGFVRFTLDGGTHNLTGEYFRAFASSRSPGASPAVADSFRLDLRSHTLR